ncbi:uncharacterized protein LOC126748258 [Anthonomus grandis grandis]|uniref:uncharacterized protein LOC126748258 n=1 Tax=Anthonomus grandis grandis TaxID=2921223 RepID=UPI002165BBD8|nr:uncharacterized protein LOC126748258 [Anthonomus grandis grandis]
MTIKALVIVSALLVLCHAQFGQYPPAPFSGESPFSYPFQHAGLSQFRPGPYQLRSPPPPPPPHHFNPFDNVYNEEGEKLTCRMVCSASANDTDEVEELKPEKKESAENNIEKRDG